MRETLQETASRQRDNRQAELSLPTGVPMPTGEVEHRLMVLREGLIGGMSRPELVALAQQQWQVSRRTAYGYMQRLREQMMEEAREEGRSAVQQTGQAQRNPLLGAGAARNAELRPAPAGPGGHVHQDGELPRCGRGWSLRKPRRPSNALELQPGFPKTPTPATHRRLQPRPPTIAREAEEAERQKTRGATIQVTAQHTIAQAVMLPSGEPDCTNAPVPSADSIDADLVHKYLANMELCRQTVPAEQLQTPAPRAQTCTNLHNQPEGGGDGMGAS